jgi:hypothetical protein
VLGVSCGDHRRHGAFAKCVARILYKLVANDMPDRHVTDEISHVGCLADGEVHVGTAANSRS